MDRQGTRKGRRDKVYILCLSGEKRINVLSGEPSPEFQVPKSIYVLPRLGGWLCLCVMSVGVKRFYDASAALGSEGTPISSRGLRGSRRNIDVL